MSTRYWKLDPKWCGTQPAVWAAIGERIKLATREKKQSSKGAEKPTANSEAREAAGLEEQREKEIEEKKQAALARLAKKEANQRSLCNLEIKPWGAEQDLLELYARIKAEVKQDGLKWSEGCNLVEVAFGVKKIVCTAVIATNLSMDAIIEEMTEESFADDIQSMSMTSMSLL